ncbi:TetR family transcriptional regulator [Kribbella amoyensis]|uniref:TetR family transcriptional regulator n=1 Tax=Kribbella amoyensis TaxID=996641 RepID=A0A561B2H4_9ACTN|nr:TetR/AcrR family transcriptional regulator C-terminal domain-containing protein [Kribbella amoyensis]TWD73067.1 TetR family transcriptional regulator [Kribbella amoyensis]
MPRDTLTADQIVNAAIELLDADGIEGLNMRALGKRLDSAATAVYWHVKSKDNLVRLVTDRVWGELELPEPTTATDWRIAAAAMATDLYGLFIRHPWLVQVFATHLVYGDSKARHDDHSLGLYEAAGFTSTQADQAVATVFTYVLGNASGAAATASLTRRLQNDATAEQFEEAMAQAQAIGLRYPYLRARLETPAGTTYAAAPERTFEFGLQALLDGLHRELTQ